jgi:hypothetical protein
MGRSTNVKSIDALREVSAALKCFHEDAARALDDLDMEMRRALQWIGDDCRQYWKQEIRRGRDRLTESKLQLENARTFRRIGEQQNSCIEEKKSVDMAKRRVQIAEEKSEAVKHWATTVERTINEYRASRTQFSAWLEDDFHKAVAALGRMIAALETYVSMGTPADESASVWESLKAPAEPQAETAEHAEKNGGTPPPPESNIE